MKKKIISKKLVIILTSGLFICFLSFLHLIWMNFTNIPTGVSAKQGLLDLRSIDTSHHFKVKLQGEWEFYPNVHLASKNEQSVEQNRVYTNQPEPWDHYFKNKEKSLFGTYRLKILKEHTYPQMYGITIPDGLAPYELYINGKFIGGLGSLQSDNDREAPISRPVTYYFTLNTNESEIMIQGVQANPYIPGGFQREIILGDLQSMEQSTSFSIDAQMAVLLVYLFYLLFAILLWGIGVRNKTLFYLALFIFSTCFTILTSSNRILFSFLPINWIWANKLYYLSYIHSALFFVLLIRELMKDYAKPKILTIVPLLYTFYIFFIVVAPIEYIFKTKMILIILFILSPIIVTIFTLIIALKGQQGMIFLLLTGATSATNSLFFYSRQNTILPYSHYPIDMLIGITALSAFWFTEYFQTTLQTEKLSGKLQKEINTKDDFLANTSHELRNPLHGMMSIAQTMLAKQEDKETRDDLKLMVRIGNHMTHMLDDLLDLVKLKEKTLRLQLKPVNAYNLVSGVSNMFRFMLKGKPVELVVQMPINSPLVLADETRLMQIFMNLIHNAIKFTEKGTITIDAEIVGKQLYVSVTDTGIGIDEDMQERVFDPYEQVDSTMTSIGGGLGLGLRICQELVSLHGGTMSVSSTIGKGSTFTFSLPIAKIQTVEDSESIDEEQVLLKYTSFLSDISKMEDSIAASTEKDSLLISHAKILIVDDDAVNLQVLVNAFSTESFEIETAISGAEALEKLKSNAFDLVISDIMMPHMSGYDLAKHIRKKFSISELPLLFLTARQQSEDIQLAFLSGANDYVKKPMEYLELKSRVQALIRMKQSSEERLRIEAAWLQAQIQPHFFFNTLNSIISLHGIDNEKMEELLLAFSDYLQMSFDFQNVDLVVPIDYELKLVRAYITIEQIRFGDRVQVVWDTPNNMDLFVPPLTIQTLVENAVQHGILSRREGGSVNISIHESEDHFTVTISDNGIGFDPKNANKKASVGLVNTEQRLKQLFGVELSIDSVIGQGTTISFPVPKN
ncbi:ATP-binding protein [Lysinibacillus capsici]|nr:ATP-binding protein [Lysinibacillus capsici]MDP1396073.1 ATP-binding protein [Lysinibacillus capsici]MDP1432645.1 ATP-binding protein [Lysinibacillus capsici]